LPKSLVSPLNRIRRIVMKRQILMSVLAAIAIFAVTTNVQAGMFGRLSLLHHCNPCAEAQCAPCTPACEPCVPACDPCEPVCDPCDPCGYKKPFRPFAGLFAKWKGKFAKHGCNPCEPACDPCVPACDPCEPVCDPCEPTCCDPCGKPFRPFGGFFANLKYKFKFKKHGCNPCEPACDPCEPACDPCGCCK